MMFNLVRLVLNAFTFTVFLFKFLSKITDFTFVCLAKLQEVFTHFLGVKLRGFLFLAGFFYLALQVCNISDCAL